MSKNTAKPARIGLIVNPIAGMGGSVGLKGTDGASTLAEALARGAQPLSQARTVRALTALLPIAEKIRLLVAPDAMGRDAIEGLGFEFDIVGSYGGGTSAANDTCEGALAMKRAGADLILFAGGDGTARDLLSSLGGDVALLGIPCGVKMYSGVFATSPESAGHVAREFIDGVGDTDKVEVMDIDEAAYRAGQLNAELYGYASCPRVGHRLQGPKTRSSPTPMAAIRSAAREIAQRMQPDDVYFIGPGTSAGAVLEALGLRGSLLGVDAVCDKALVGLDLTGAQVRNLAQSHPVHLVLGVVGGQGYVLGRGNQQIPADVIRQVSRERLILLASEDKLAGLSGGRLLIDTGDGGLDKQLEGYVRVNTGAGKQMMMHLSAGH